MKEKKNSLWLYIILVLLLVVIGIGIGYYFYSKYNNKVNEKSDNNETKNNQLYERTEAEKSIGLEYPYVIQKEIKKSDGTIVGYTVCKIDEKDFQEFGYRTIPVCEYNSTYYYIINDKQKTKKYNYIGYLSDDYIYASNYVYDGYYDNDYDNPVCDILDINTGEFIRKINYYSVRTEKINGKYYYIASSSSEVENVNTILNQDFNPIIKDFETYAYVINDNNTITIIPYGTYKYDSTCDTNLLSKFFIYDLNGNKIYESKEYNHVVGIGKNYNAKYGYGDLLVVDNGNINIIDYKENILKTLAKGKICGVTDNERIYNDYYFYLDDGMYSYDRKNDMLINLDKEDVKISNLTSVNNDGFIEDFSKWYYLAENNDYIILISDKLYGNFNKGVGDVTVIKKAFEANGIDFGKEGYMVNLDKDHLINYFDCDIKKLKCENNLNYVKKYKSIGTSLEINSIQVSLNSDGTFEIPSADTLIDSMPIIIKILKSSIK